MHELCMIHLNSATSPRTHVLIIPRSPPHFTLTAGKSHRAIQSSYWNTGLQRTAQITDN